MASIFDMALPGSIPTYGAGAKHATPEKLFRAQSLDDMQRMQGMPPAFDVEKVKVRIFDLSDEDQVSEYEKLWKELLEKSAKMEVVVESRKDLVHRKDGTSYWMKYVEYVEFSEAGKKEKQKEGESE